MLSAYFKFCLLPVQILLLYFILGYCDMTRESSTKRTKSVDDFEVNAPIEEPLSTETSVDVPPTSFSALLKDVSKDVSDGLQQKKKVHGFEYS